jgi:large subunit ribosomal protein L23
MRYAGKVKSRYTRTGVLVGRTNSFKKAIITLKDAIKLIFIATFN